MVRGLCIAPCRTVGDIQPESKSAKEISALWLYLRDRLARLNGGLDPHWAKKPRADFSTIVLTPESASAPQLPVAAAASAAAASINEEDDWEPDLPTWASVAVATMDRRQAGAAVKPSPQAARPTTNIELPKPVKLDRRKSDRGPPTGVVDRRLPRSFGRRSTP